MPAPRLILDTNAALDLLHFDDPRCAALREQLRGDEVVAVTNAACRDEWRRVLRYPALALDAARIAELEATYDAVMIDIAARPAPAPLPRCKDPDDQKFLELARDAGAIAVLTRDAELLKLNARLQRDFAIRVVLPEAF